MLGQRLGFYVSDIFLIALLISHYGVINGVLFRKNNTRWVIRFCSLALIPVMWYAITTVYSIPASYNRVEKKITGTVVEHTCVDISTIREIRTYTLLLKDETTGELYKCQKVSVHKKIRKGDEVEVHYYGFICASNRMITKVNGKELYYKKIDYPINKTYEKLFAIGVLSIQAAVMCYLARLEYVKGGRKKRGKNWCIMTCITAGIYGLFPWITYTMTDKSKEIGIGLSAIFTIYMIERCILAWKANIDEHLNEWQAIPLNEIRIKEEKKQRKAEEKRQFRKEMEEWERKENEKIEKKQSATETDRAKEHQFQQMNYLMTQQYCNLKFRCCMKNSVINAAGMGLTLVFVTVIVLAFSSDKVFAWFGYIVGVSVVLALLIIGMGCIRGYHKNKKFKEIPASGKPLEYTTVVAEIGEEKRFLCSDGHEEVWKMKDDDMKVKEGQEAVVIYVPSTGEMITEKPDILHKIFEGWKGKTM